MWREALETGVLYVKLLPILQRTFSGTAFLLLESFVEFAFPSWWDVAIRI
jgi:hypothetical protein